jgi:hypothetical protein
MKQSDSETSKSKSSKPLVLYTYSKKKTLLEKLDDEQQVLQLNVSTHFSLICRAIKFYDNLYSILPDISNRIQLLRRVALFQAGRNARGSGYADPRMKMIEELHLHC